MGIEPTALRWFPLNPKKRAESSVLEVHLAIGSGEIQRSFSSLDYPLPTGDRHEFSIIGNLAANSQYPMEAREQREIAGLGGGGRSLVRTRLRLRFPANREIYREFRSITRRLRQTTLCPSVL